ncbi:MAG: DUF4153 domain-containing protein [Lawsonibacter sp.]|nr:DUF4153 domain-containing protein [Lawsonibacter sp.]
MSKIFQSIIRVFKGSFMALKRYPASIGCAVAFSIVTMIRIQLDWQQQEPYHFLFNCLHWSLALGAIVSLTAILLASSRFDSKKAFVLANFFGILVAAVSFLLLFLFARINTEYRDAMIANIAQTRIAVLILVSFILFILFASVQGNHMEFDLALFMTQKAFFISLIYGIIIFAGASGVARAVEYLIYNNMSQKVYMYIGTLSGLIGYILFVGYFPDFTKGVVDPKRNQAQLQPRFIEVLFSYIMIPIVLILTLVLLLWTVRTVMTGMHVRFIQLYSIASAYTIGGLWLHAMTIRNESSLAKVYRIVYPFASFVILIFEAWAVISQLLETGLKTTEYVFILIWILACSGSILIITKKIRAHALIALTACMLAMISIQPVIGYQALPVSAQSHRLETLLISQGMLTDNTLSPAKTTPDESVRIAITDAVNFLLNVQAANLPVWFDPDGINRNSFDAVFGFEQAWPKQDDYENPITDYKGIHMSLGVTAMPIDDYDWVVRIQNYMKDQPSMSFTGKNGKYIINWNVETATKSPEIRIVLNNQVVVETSLDNYFDKLTSEYGVETYRDFVGDLDDMSISFETPSFDALLVLNFVDFSFSTSNDEIHYSVEPGALYIKEK